MEKHKLLNEQKSFFGNKMIKVALGLRMWVEACVRGPKCAHAGTILRT